MKALIILENHFIKDQDGNVWCDRVVDYSYLKRYLSVFEEIVVCGRFSSVESLKDKKLLVSGDNVSFLELPDFRGAKGLILNYSNINKKVKLILPEIDCVIMRAPTHLAFVTYRLFVRKKIPFAIEFMMAADNMFEGKSLFVKIINSILVIEAKNMCKKANGVSYVTRNILQKAYPCSAQKTNNSKYFTSSYSSIDLPKEYFYKQNWSKKAKPKTFKIIHTGYMDSYRKGQDVLIKVIKKLVNDGYKNIQVTLVGDGNKRSEFEDLAKKLKVEKYISFKGMIKEKSKILNELKESHLFVFPTLSEGLPRSIIEAMSVGLPCVSNSVDGIPELLEEEFLVINNDIDSYVQIIKNLLNNWDKMIDVGNRNYSEALKYEKRILDNRRKSFYLELRKGVNADESNKKTNF